MHTTIDGKRSGNLSAGRIQFAVQGLLEVRVSVDSETVAVAFEARTLNLPAGFNVPANRNVFADVESVYNRCVAVGPGFDGGP